MPSTWQDETQTIDPEFEDVPEKAPAEPESTEKLAVVSLVAGIAGFFLPVVGPVTAVVSGHVARGEIRRSRGRLGGDALAKTGLILGYIWIALTLLVVGLCVPLFMMAVTTIDRVEVAAPRPAPWSDTQPVIFDREAVGLRGHDGHPGRVETIEVPGVSIPKPGSHSGSSPVIRLYRSGSGGHSAVIAPPAPPEPPDPIESF
jgi:hypothetical protein